MNFITPIFMKLAGTVLAVFGSALVLSSVSWDQVNIIHWVILAAVLFLLVSIGISIFIRGEQKQEKLSR